MTTARDGASAAIAGGMGGTGEELGRGQELTEKREARRIARELVTLYHAGVITGADDPNLVLYACLIRDFGGTVLPKEGQDTTTPDGNPPPGVLVPGKPYTPTEEQRVRIPYGLTKRTAKEVPSRRP